MNRLQELLQDLRTMPGVTGAFLCSRDGVIATTMADHSRQNKMGRVYLNILSGAFSLGHFIQEIYCGFDNAVLLTRPVSRGCVLVAVCKPGVTVRLVDISLTMTVKSVEEELNGLDVLPRPLPGLAPEDRAEGHDEGRPPDNAEGRLESHLAEESTPTATAPEDEPETSRLEEVVENKT